MRLGFTESCLDNFHLQEQKQTNFCRIFYVLVGFCYPCIFFPYNFLSAALGFILLDLQPDLAGLGGIIATHAIQIVLHLRLSVLCY